MEYKEEDFLQLSGIQHFKFCRRQWALIHIENQWAENFRTVDGEILHKNAHDKGFRESRGEVLITRGMHVFSASMGVSGECDVLEFHRDETGIPLKAREGLWRPYPVEYKANPMNEAATPCSFARRPYAWRKCCAAIFRKARCIMGRSVTEWLYPLRRSCAIKCG